MLFLGVKFGQIFSIKKMKKNEKKHWYPLLPPWLYPACFPVNIWPKHRCKSLHGISQICSYSTWKTKSAAPQSLWITVSVFTCSHSSQGNPTCLFVVLWRTLISEVDFMDIKYPSNTPQSFSKWFMVTLQWSV